MNNVQISRPDPAWGLTTSQNFKPEYILHFS